MNQNRLHHLDIRTPQKTATTLLTSTLRSVGTKAKLTQPTHGQSLALLTIITTYRLATWARAGVVTEAEGGVKVMHARTCLDHAKYLASLARPVPHHSFSGYSDKIPSGGSGGGHDEDLAPLREKRRNLVPQHTP